MKGRRIDFVSLLGTAGAYLFITCLYTSPGDSLPQIAFLHPALLSAVLMLGAMMVNRVLGGRPLRFVGGVGATMTLLFGFAGLSVLWAIDPSEAVGFAIGAVKLMFAFVGIATVLQGPDQIRRALTVAVIASMIPALGTIQRYREGIGLVEGFRGNWLGLLANPNQLAMVMAVTIPWAMMLQSRASPFLRMILIAALGLEIGAIVATHSRGGALGLGAAMFASALLAQRKARAFGLLGIAFAMLLVLAPQSFWARTETIQDYHLDASAQGRIQSWQTGFRAFGDSPLLGVGANNYVLTWDTYANRNVRERAYAAHNMWMQVLVELGLIGIGLFATMFFLILRGLWRTRMHPEVGQEARALAASLVALVICGSTGGYAFNWFFYMVLGLAGAVIAYAREFPGEEADDELELALA
jgi:O-antigen ligase